MIEMIRGSLRCLLQKKLQLILTVAGIAVGVLSVLLIYSICTAGSGVISGELDALGFDCMTVSSVNKSVKLTEERLQTLRAQPDVAVAAPVMTGTCRVTMREMTGDAVACGVDGSIGSVVNLQYAAGGGFTSGEVEQNEPVCVVGEKLARQYYGRANIVGKTVEVTLSGRTRELRVVGVLAAGGSALEGIAGDYIPAMIYLPYTVFQEMTGRYTLDMIFVRPSARADYSAVGQRIVRLLDASEGESVFRVEDLAAQKEKLNGIFRTVTYVLSAVGTVSLLVSGLGIMTIMLVSVSDRTREIGIRRAVGARSGRILLEFLTESSLISLAGGAVGVAASALLCGLARRLTGYSVAVSLSAAGDALLFSIAVGAVFGVYPAMSAARLKPVDALRHE